jgi:REP element-mobilizing transposase RayT
LALAKKNYVMPFVKVFIHFVWSTKNRYPFLDSKEKRELVWKHIYENAKKKDIYIDFIGGYSDHCHCLVSLSLDQNLKEIVQLLKGESSFWINKQQICSSHFQWQNDYFASSVSESLLNKTRKYIKAQEAHHQNVTFGEEYELFLIKHGFKRHDD